MNIDTPTLMTMESFVAACAGAVLFVVWSQNRKVSALALWGLANIVAAAGIFSLMLGPVMHQPVWSTTRRHPAGAGAGPDVEGGASF